MQKGKTRGGYRSGAGRPIGSKNKNTIVELEARATLVNKILTNWNPIIDALLSVGLGKATYVNTKNGKEITYAKPPNPQVLLDLISFVVGKPKMELSGNIDLPQLERLSDDVRAILEKK
jgi:hypothetical protein